MPAERTPLLGGLVRVLELDRFHDERGSLIPLTFDRLGFSVARTFVVCAPRGAVRGGHAHRRVRQVLFRASGTIDVEVGVDDGGGGAHARVTLDEERPALLIEPGVWAQQTYLDEGATLIVFADGPYEPAEYVPGNPGDGSARS